MRISRLLPIGLLAFAGLAIVPMSATPASAAVSGSTCAARPTPGIFGDYQSYCPPGNGAYWHRVVVVCAGCNAAGRWVPSNQISRASCGTPKSFRAETWVGRPPVAWSSQRAALVRSTCGPVSPQA